MVYIVLLHVLINVSTASLSLYLAHALSDFSESGEDENTDTAVGEEGEPKKKAYAGILLLIVIVCIMVTTAGKFFSSAVFMSINRNMHTKAVDSLIHTKMAFFDANTSGRIMNRLSKDVMVLDQFVFSFLEMLDYIIKCAFSVVFVVFSSPITAVIVFIQLCYFYRLSKRVLSTTADCMRLKQLLNSPIVSLIQDSINGSVTARAMGSGKFFLNEFMRLSDVQTGAFVTSNGINRYSAYRIDMQAYMLVTIFAAFSLFSDAPKTPGELAVKAIGFQMAVEVARHFNTAIRWTFVI